MIRPHTHSLQHNTGISYNAVYFTTVLYTFCAGNLSHFEPPYFDPRFPPVTDGPLPEPANNETDLIPTATVVAPAIHPS